MSDPRESPLRQLAERAGILNEYVDQTGRETRRTSDDTRRSLLSAMRFDVSSEGAIRDALAALDEEARAELIPPVDVVRRGDAASLRLARSLDECTRVEVHLEKGERRTIDFDGGTRTLDVGDLPLGYHRIVAVTTRGGREMRAEQLRVVVPERCVTPGELLDGRKAFGITANLYTVRSGTNWGIGDFSDLASLARWGGAQGAQFVGVNPLHALLNRGTDVSPYSPVSRLFRNPIYIDPAQVPALASAGDVRSRLRSDVFGAELDALRETPAVRYEQVMAVKGIVLDALFRAFDAAEGSYQREFQDFVQRGGTALRRHATWMAIAERHGADWRAWPDALRQPDSPAVARYADEHASRVRYHSWLQYEADRQLGVAASAAATAGMRLGIYQDLAIGSSPAGSDTWAFPDLFARGVAVGAPPDPYSATGQNWGLPPIDPLRLRRSGYAYFIQLLRGAFRHAGALRMDHVLGLFRLFWIPDGAGGEDGAYVRYPCEDLFGILALESVRNNALVVGEDLGTVPPEVPPTLERWGVLSSKVMIFERGEHGSFKSPDSYPPLALATANTHDMAPLAGYWMGADIEIRTRVGLTKPEDVAGEEESREVDRQRLLERLAAEHLMGDGRGLDSAGLRGAVHAMLCRTPSELVGIALDDLAGETQPVNVPGVGPDRYPSWTRKMREPIETITASSDVLVALRCDGRRGVSNG